MRMETVEKTEKAKEALSRAMQEKQFNKQHNTFAHARFMLPREGPHTHGHANAPSKDGAPPDKKAKVVTEDKKAYDRFKKQQRR